MTELFTSLFLNISLLLCTTAFLVELKFFRRILQGSDACIRYQVLLGVLYGTLACLTTYLGIDVNGAIANTRVVSVAGAGLIAGPIAGLTAGLIGGVHRYFYNPAGFTSLACCVGTIFFGIVGSLGRAGFSRTKHKRLYLACVTAIGEFIQVIWLVILAHPLSAVLELERIIFIPKIIVNSFGMILMFEAIDRLRQNHSNELIEYQTRALYIADQCLPYLREGLANREKLGHAAKIICSNAYGYDVLFTDTQNVLASTLPAKDEIPDCVRECLESKNIVVREFSSISPLAMESVSAPLYSNESVIGTLTLYLNEPGLPLADSDIQFAGTLAHFFSTILELKNVEYQIELRHKAESRAFQAQINPHFFYNSLNTISAFCRTKPDEARRLLLTLADYYRHSLSANEEFVTLESELKNVENYMIITRARFEDAVHMELDWPEDACELMLPPLIIQPLVENAVRHGGTSVGERHVKLNIRQKQGRLWVSVSDRGHGFPQEILDDLADPNNTRYSGLFNVSKRLLSIYGEESRLQVDSTPHGSTVLPDSHKSSRTAAPSR